MAFCNKRRLATNKVHNGIKPYWKSYSKWSHLEIVILCFHVCSWRTFFQNPIHHKFCFEQQKNRKLTLRYLHLWVSIAFFSCWIKLWAFWTGWGVQNLWILSHFCKYFMKKFEKRGKRLWLSKKDNDNVLKTVLFRQWSIFFFDITILCLSKFL